MSIIISTAGADNYDNFIRGMVNDSSVKFDTDTTYYLGVGVTADSGYDLTEMTANDVIVNVNGQTVTAKYLYRPTNEFFVAVVELPKVTDEVVNYSIPIKKTVTLGGKNAPGKATFNFEIVDGEGNAVPTEELAEMGITYTAAVEINGAGTDLSGEQD